MYGYFILVNAHICISCRPSHVSTLYNVMSHGSTSGTLGTGNTMESPDD